MNARSLVSKDSLRVILVVSALLLTACQPVLVQRSLTSSVAEFPTVAAPQSTVVPNATPLVISSDTLSGGVALAYQAQRSSGQSLYPVDTVLFGNDWSTMIEDDRYKALRSQLGCVEMMLVKPNSGAGPVYLAFTQPIAGAIITPTIWSEYSVFDRIVDDPEAETGQRVIVVSRHVTIDKWNAVTPADPCGSKIIADDLSHWKRETGLQPADLDGLIVSARQADGSFKQTLIIIEPEGGASCSAAKTVCSKCNNCGRQFICKVVQKIQSWIC